MPTFTLSTALRLAPYVAIALLVGLFLWQRNSLTAARADVRTATAAIAQLNETNRANVAQMAKVAQARIDNDAIASAVAERLAGNGTRETHTETVIREVMQNDPVSRAWGDTPVPDSVRSALARPGDRVPQPAR